MQTPTIGRVVWFRATDTKPDAQPNAATIAYVHSNLKVNLTVSLDNGETKGVQDVLLWSGEGDRPNHAFCEWPAKPSVTETIRDAGLISASAPISQDSLK